MAVATVPSSASQTPLGARADLAGRRSPPNRRQFLLAAALRSGGGAAARCSALVKTQDPATDAAREPRKGAASKQRKRRVKAVALDAAAAAEAETRAAELDYGEVAAALENIYKLSPAEVSDVDEDEEEDGALRKRRRRTRDGKQGVVVRSRKRRGRRLSLDKRIAMRKRRKEGEEEVVAAADVQRKRSKVSRTCGGEEDEDAIERLVRDYSASTDLVSLDWRKMKIPPVLSSAEHTWLFKLMQPMKALMQVKENLCKDLSREPTDDELAEAVNMTVPQIRRHIEVGPAARNKLIKHNLRLVLFAINKYYQEIANGQKFQDLCQAGAKGLITAIDRFELKRGFRLSTYALFWIRHSIVRFMTMSSFTRISFGIESVRQEIQKAKLELIFELGRLPTKEEIIARVGISPERHHDVMKASKAVFSLNAKHPTTQEEFLDGLTDIDGVGGDKRRQPALLRLALDDVLDSLKPKESLVMRQRYGLDGKGDRTLGEIAGNLNISREMVRKHELKALMKLKHPARVDYLRRYIV